MPDPRVVYIVTAVVVAALFVWVIAVLTRSPPQAPRAAGPLDPTDAKDTKDAKDTQKSRPPLNSHLEIQDTPDAKHEAADK
jgi:hypothetical protein